MLAALRLDLAQTGVRVVHPETPGYETVAGELARELQAVTGLMPGVMAETAPGALAGPGPLLVLGNLMASATVRRLYCEAYDFTDHAFPGPGGCVVRTIRDPFGTGAPVVLLGGSDLDGVRQAARRLGEWLRADGAVLGYRNEVRLGRWTTAEQLDTVRYLGPDDEVWQRVGQSGSWDYIDHIAKCGTGYLRTGDERYLVLFQRELRRFMAADVFNHNPEAPPMLHGRMYVLLGVWDLVADHPLFDEAERSRVDAMFLHVARSGEGTAHIREVAATQAVRYNHHTRAGLDAFFVGRYFARRYGLPEAHDWLAVAERLFAPQLASAKPACDSWGHQWAASLFNTLVYALATDRRDYLVSRALRDAADRALIAYGHGAPRRYLAACALATGDTGYLSQEQDLTAFATESAQLRVEAGQSRLVNFTDEVLRTFTGDVPIVRRTDLLGQALAPLDGLWRESIETETYNPGGIFAVTVPAAAAFDKLALRDGWAADDFYLLLDGIAGGHHAYQDANCLAWLREAGVDWLLPRTGYQHALGSRAQNGVNVVMNGRGAGRMARYARLLYRGTQGDFSATGTAITGVGEADWERHILRKRGAWTLVIDRVVGGVAGEMLVERFWFPHGECATGAAGFICRQRLAGAERRLHFVSTVAADGGECGGEMPCERIRCHIEAGAALVLGGLWWTEKEGPSAGCTLTRNGTGWRVTEAAGGTTTEIDLTGDEGQGTGVVVCSGGSALNFGHGRPPGASRTLPVLRPLRVSSASVVEPWRALRVASGPVSAVAGDASGCVAGTSDGAVITFDGELRERWRARLPSAVIALELSDGEVVAGEERGALTLFDGAGGRRWTVEIPWMTLPWAYWGEGRSRIREIATADIDGDGVKEILVSNADRRVYAFDRTGRELWRRPIEWGVFTASWPDGTTGKFVLFGGTSRPSIHGYAVLLGGDGSVTGRWQRPDLTCWSMPSAMRDLLRADINGDDRVETVTALDTNCRQLVAYTADGVVHWDLDVGGAAGALAFDAGSRRVFCATDAGYVVAVDGATGRREWLAWIGEAAALLWLLPDRRLLAVARSGRGWVISAAGAVEERGDAGSTFSALPRPGDHRAAGRRWVLGTADGRMLTIQPGPR